MPIRYFLVFFLVLQLPLPALAYVGPGLGLGALGVILGVIFSIFLAVVGVFWYPIKRLIQKFKKPKPRHDDP